MVADRKLFGHGYTMKRRSQCRSTASRLCKPTLDADDIQFIVFGFFVTNDTVQTKVKSVLSKYGTSEKR